MGLTIGNKVGIGSNRLGTLLKPVINLQRQLIDVVNYINEMDSTSGFTGVNTDSITINTNEKFSGNASLKVIAKAANTAYTLTWTGSPIDLSSDSGKSLNIYVYPHSPLNTCIKQFEVFAYNADNSCWYKNCTPNAGYMPVTQNKWNVMKGDLWQVNGGTPNWNAITKITFRLEKDAGVSGEISFDFINERPRKPAVLMLFDDQFISCYTKAFPKLKSKKMVGTQYVVGNAIGSTGRMTADQLKHLYNSGWDIANQTMNHENLTTLTQQQVEDTLEQCRVVLDSLGMTRASRHISTPYYAKNSTVEAAFSNWGAKTCTILQQLQLSGYNYFYESFPYNIYDKFLGNSTTLSAAKGWVDRCLLTNSVLVLHFDDIVDSNAGASSWLTSDFEDLVDYIASKDIQTLTIDEYYRLYSNDITVYHK